MSKKVRQIRKQPPRRLPWPWLAVGGAVLLIVAGLVMSWSSAKPEPAAPGGGTPRLAVDRTVADEGNMKFDVPVRTAFRLSNVGRQALQILGEPQVELVEGC